MAIAISDDHHQLESTARAFLDDHKARAAARALLEAETEGRPDFWGAMAQIGWLGLHLPEEYGGSGYGLPELVVVVEELGRAVAPGPFVPTVIASAVVAALGSPTQQAALLPGLADGQTTGAVGLDGELTLTASSSGAGLVADGDAGGVLGAGLADVLVLGAGEDLVLVRAGAPGVTVTVPKNVDPTRRAGRVRLDSTPLADTDVIRGGRRRALALARTIVAAEAAGGAQECVDRASEYARERLQFGRPIGMFQAVKHHCANMLVAAEMATAAVWDAARAAGDGDEFELASAVACTLALRGFVDDAQLNIQVHGGIGFTWEHDAHLLLRRAIALSSLFDPDRAAAEVTELSGRHVTRHLGLDLPPEAEPLRAEVARVAAELAALDPAAQRQRLIETGYVMPHWPEPWGREAGALEQLVIDEEFARAGVNRPNYGITGWVILTLIQHATPDQVQRWVRPTLDGTLVWCQLFSEPDAGSDAAGIKTRATRVDGGWVLNGQKVWTSGAQYAQRGLATVRTDPDAPKHAGITTVVVEMDAPGVEVRPLRQITGGSDFNEVFFTDVFVPDDDVVGQPNHGWTVARATLGNERVTIGGGATGLLAKADLPDLLGRYPDRLAGGATRVGALLAREHSLGLMNLRRVTRTVAGADPGPEGNVTKLLLAESGHERAAITAALLGPETAFIDGLGGMGAMLLLATRAMSIAGGTSEITRNQIGERILGLPRDPLVK